MVTENWCLTGLKSTDHPSLLKIDVHFYYKKWTENILLEIKG